MSPSGISLYVTTDQVRFRRRRLWQPLPLTEVPPLVFTEVMRDVDLFVGVCSVGNDPTWADNGPEALSGLLATPSPSGDLSASAKTRRVVLERLIPRLKIADRCSRHRQVPGRPRRPADLQDPPRQRQHPDGAEQPVPLHRPRAAAAPPSDPAKGVFLPFEGDGQLSVILSKAFLLADDTAITDPTITRQIRR